MLINLFTEDIHQTKTDILGFLTETDTDLKKITTVTVCDTPLYDEDHCFKLDSKREENIPLGRSFITTPADTNT